MQWNIPGKIFLAYNPSDTSATLNTSVDTTSRTVRFCWADVGNNRNISASFTVNGQEEEASATLNVKDPTVEFPTVDGVSFDPPPLGAIVQKFNPDGVILENGYNNEGIYFKAKVKRPAGFETAQWQYTQVVKANRTHREESTGDCFSNREVNNSGEIQEVADLRFAYAGPWSDGDTIRDAADSPAAALDSGHAQENADEVWRMFIMFKPADNEPPAAGNSAWVPLRSCTWKWRWCAMNESQGWVLYTHIEDVNSWVENRTHPTWDTNTENLDYDSVNCPPPCEGS